MKRNGMNYLLITLGLAMLGVGVILVKTLAEPQGIMLALPYVLVGVGCGTFGHAAGNLLSKKAVKNHPEIARQIEIDRKDERNVAIGIRAKAKAYDAMVFVFGALMLSFALMRINLIATLLLVCAYLFVVGCALYYRIRYDKEM